MVGNILGQRVLSKISDKRFRVVLKWVLTLLAMRMVLLFGWSLRVAQNFQLRSVELT